MLTAVVSTHLEDNGLVGYLFDEANHDTRPDTETLESAREGVVFGGWNTAKTDISRVVHAWCLDDTSHN